MSTPELAAPYGNGAGSTGSPVPPKRVRIPYLQELKHRGEPWPMLTAYDMYAAELFDEAGIPVLLVGDSASNNVYGYDTSLPVTVEELLPLVRAVTRATKRALVVADLPFGSYQLSPEQALGTGVRFMKEGRAHAVKLEGGRRFAAHVEALTSAGVPVMGHIGFTPQSEHNLGGYRVQGRGNAGDDIVADAVALQGGAAGRRGSSSATRIWPGCCPTRPARSRQTSGVASSRHPSTPSTDPSAAGSRHPSWMPAPVEVFC